MEALVAEQVAYYRARAPDYDDAYLGKAWDRSIDELPIAGDVLELACGSGHWTPMLAARARSVTAVDAAPEMLALARRRVRDPSVEFLQADLFDWRAPRRYDTVFFAFWLTHVPPARFAAFWSTVGAALAPGGQVCFVSLVRSFSTDTCDARSPTLTAHARRGPAVPGALRTQHGPGSSRHSWLRVPAAGCADGRVSARRTRCPRGPA